LFTVIYDEPNVIKKAIDEQTYALEKQANKLHDFLNKEPVSYIEGWDY
jgi:hypothetical protein